MTGDVLLHRKGSAVCEHADVRYFKDERGAIACMVCGRLFGHLTGATFTAYNPIREPVAQWCAVCKLYHDDGLELGEKSDAGQLVRPCPRIAADDPRNRP